jgi:hypothetical protein
MNEIFIVYLIACNEIVDVIAEDTLKACLHTLCNSQGQYALQSFSEAERAIYVSETE